FLRYVDTKPNKKELGICIFDGPYVMTDVIVPAKSATSTKEVVPEHNVPKTYKNTTPDKHSYFDAEAKAIHMILSGIGDDIYFIVDACTIAKEMWISIERLQQGESLNKQDVKTNLFWEFGKFTSRDGESIESYYLRNANPLALVAATQHYPDDHYQVPKPHKTHAPSTRSHATTRNKGKEIVKPIIHPSESASEEDNDPEHAQREADKEKTKNDRNTRQFVNKMTETVAGNMETIGNQDADEEPNEQELEAHYMYMEKIQEVLFADSGPTYDAEPLEKQHESINDTYVVETVDTNDIPNSSDMCDNEGKANQNAKEYEDERVVLANLIAYLKLDTDENKKIQKQLKKANTTLTHELNECKSALEESNGIRDRFRSALHDHDIELETYKKYKNFQLEKEEVEHDINEQTEMQCLYLAKYQECENLKIELSKSNTPQTDKHFANLEQHCIELELALQHQKEKNVFENSWFQQPLTSGQNNSLIVELNRKTLETDDLKA
ncbi:hypothetical protein Tco_0725180, partial [Tanacetum coccineum]